MHPDTRANKCIEESLKIGEPEHLDREIERAKVHASLAIAYALENIADAIRDLKTGFISVEVIK